MKLRVYKEDLVRAIMFYNELLAQDHAQVALSEADKEKIRRAFDELQKKKQKQEKTNMWFAPYYVKFLDNRQYTVDVDVDDKNLLIMER